MESRKPVGHNRGGHELKNPPKSDPTGFARFGLSPELLRAVQGVAQGEITTAPHRLDRHSDTLDRAVAVLVARIEEAHRGPRGLAQLRGSVRAALPLDSERRRDWRDLTLVSTLSPCPMCSGTAVLFKIPRVVIGENETFQGAEQWMRGAGIELVVLNDPRCIALMERLQREKPELWAEDIGE